MKETAIERKTRHVTGLEQTRQVLIDTLGLWERRKAAHHVGADEMLVTVDAELTANTQMLKVANKRLLRLSAKPG